MARALIVVALFACMAVVAFAADLRKLNEERAGLTPPAGRAGGVAGKNAGDLDTANSWGWGWGGPGFWGGPWGYGWGGYGGYGGWGYPGFYGGWW